MVDGVSLVMKRLRELVMVRSLVRFPSAVRCCALAKDIYYWVNPRNSSNMTVLCNIRRGTYTTNEHDMVTLQSQINKTKLTFFILMDFPIHIDTVSMDMSILYVKGSQVEISYCDLLSTYNRAFMPSMRSNLVHLIKRLMFF